MSRFYVPKENVRGREIVIRGREAHHIADVMRLQPDDKIVVFDGTGNEYSGFIKNINNKVKKIIIEVVSTKHPVAEKSPEIVLAQALPKRDKMDYIVEKSVELGVSRIIPIITKRTIVRPHVTGSNKKVERWGKIAVEASKQCGRLNVPSIDNVTSYSDVVQQIEQFDLVLFACLMQRTVSIKTVLSDFKTGKILVFVGPEGDFTPEEVSFADRGNTRFVSLGRRVLKSDTAGLFILSVLNYEFSM
ncbi:MAG: 16S rRNA (uracil(1498)-N(3))-methyltransferase [Candidatus Omnitrophica bacterium]|nr:16S rRNA (uracil(1498)-N(3))-methyltransferase [Candidatus Omnitrophota bacterium]